MTLRDYVRNASAKISAASAQFVPILQNVSLPMAERLQAFDALVGLEIGDTGLHRARGLEREFGLAKLYLKYEGDNPSGTQKDRIAFAQVRDAIVKQNDVVALATCGNYGVAVALACQVANLACEIFIPAGYHTERIREMEQLGSNIHRLPGTYEEVVNASSSEAKKQGWYDANPGGDNTDLQIEAYASVGREIIATLQRAPDICAVPVSNGTLFAGTYLGVQQHINKELPVAMNGADTPRTRFIAGSSTRKNPIVQSWREGLRKCRDLDPTRVRETIVNEPLINWHAFDGDEALSAIYASNGWGVNVSDRDLKDMASLIRKLEGYHVLPASTAGLIGILRHHAEKPLAVGNYVAVLTARD